MTSLQATFKTPIAPKAIYSAAKSLDPETYANVSRYILLKDMRDDIAIAISKGQATSGQLYNIDQQLAAIRQQFPVAESFSQQYNTVTQSLRDYSLSSLLTPEQKKWLDQNRQNYVSLELSDVDPEAPLLTRMKQAQGAPNGSGDAEWFLLNRDSVGGYDIERRVDPFDMLLAGTEATLSARMKNDAKMLIVDNLLQSTVNRELADTNQFTIRKATADDIEGNANRLVTFRRNGVEETYITSQLLAQLLRLDPYIAKWPALYMPKRLLEHSAVGPATVTFALKTAIRDAVGGSITKPAAIQAGTLFDVGAAVPKQLWGKALGKISQRFQESIITGDMPIPEWLMDVNKQRKFADVVGQAYTQSLYHQVNSTGGFDASLMKERIQLGKTMLDEVVRSVEGSTVSSNFKAVRLPAKVIRAMAFGMTEVFNAVQDAPRFAAIMRNQGNMPLEELVPMAKSLTGDNTKSGRVYNANRMQIEADAIDQGMLNIANRYLGVGAEVAREGIPFTNPMIQGMRRLYNRALHNPMQLNMDMWRYIGIPSVAMYGWNEMLGSEYNDYAMNERSTFDVISNMYLGIPGKPPDEGIEIPIMHETMMWNAPFTRALYGLSRGEDNARMSMALTVVAQNILMNSTDLSVPTVLTAWDAATGTSKDMSILGTAFNDNTNYQITEDNIGVLPQNAERLVRAMFSSVGDTTLDVVNALASDATPETFYNALSQSLISKTPIAKNVAGFKASNVNMSIPSSVQERRVSAYERAIQYWEQYYNEDRFYDGGSDESFQKPSLSDYYSSTNFAGDTEDDMPYLMVGPEQLAQPTNPVLKMYGGLLKDNLQNSGDSVMAARNRFYTYSKMVSRLKKFTAGDYQQLQQWQTDLEQATTVLTQYPSLQELASPTLLLASNRKELKKTIDENPEYVEIASNYGYDITNSRGANDFLKFLGSAKEIVDLQALMKDHEIDLSDYADRIDMINMLEHKRYEMLKTMQDTYTKTEALITQDLREQGVLGPDESFDVTKHLDPFDPNPFD